MDSATLSGPSTKRARLSFDLELLVIFSTLTKKKHPQKKGGTQRGPKWTGDIASAQSEYRTQGRATSGPIAGLRIGPATTGPGRSDVPSSSTSCTYPVVYLTTRAQ
eukprot:2607299-Karenia_brevis.AAC.1